MEKPNFVTNEHLYFLDNLRESGATNMFGATPYIQEIFSELDKNQAQDILKYWMRTFSERKENGQLSIMCY